MPVIKAIKVESPVDIDAARSYRDAAAMMLFDAKSPATLAGALPGGNGIAFDWTLLSSDGAPRRFVLSGGLTPVQREAGDRSDGGADRRCVVGGRIVPRREGRRADPEIHRGRPHRVSLALAIAFFLPAAPVLVV